MKVNGGRIHVGVTSRKGVLQTLYGSQLRWTPGKRAWFMMPLPSCLRWALSAAESMSSFLIRRQAPSAPDHSAWFQKNGAEHGNGDTSRLIPIHLAPSSSHSFYRRQSTRRDAVQYDRASFS